MKARHSWLQLLFVLVLGVSADNSLHTLAFVGAGLERWSVTSGGVCTSFPGLVLCTMDDWAVAWHLHCIPGRSGTGDCVLPPGVDRVLEGAEARAAAAAAAAAADEHRSHFGEAVKGRRALRRGHRTRLHTTTPRTIW